MGDLLMRYWYTFRDVWYHEAGHKPMVTNLDGYLIGHWCNLALMASIIVFVLTVIWPIAKKKQFSITSLLLTMGYVAIWVWLLKEPNPTAEYDLPLAALLTLYSGLGGYIIWNNRQLYKTKKAA